jgi:hypothetical protein
VVNYSNDVATTRRDWLIAGLIWGVLGVITIVLTAAKYLA